MSIRVSCIVALAWLLIGPASAQTLGGDAEAPATAGSAPELGQSDLLAPDRTTLLGDAGAIRPGLAARGVTVGLQTVFEVFGNPIGGIKRGASGEGLTLLTVSVDTAKAMGLPGGTIFASGLWTYGGNYAQGYLGSLQTNSNNYGLPSVRLWELYYQQSFLGGRGDVKIGQQSVDQDFMVSQASLLFLNPSTGWPAIPSIDMYGGSPVFPLASLGVRARAQATDKVTLLAGVYDDNPPGGPFFNDPQILGSERYGVRFNLGTGALMLGEVQYAFSAAPSGSGAKALPGAYKLGAWLDTAKFPDPAAGTGPGGTQRYHWHDYSVYAVADQTVLSSAGATALTLFTRPMVAPSDRNLVDFSIDSGFTVTAPFPGRRADSFGMALDIANVSNRANFQASGSAPFAGVYRPLRGAETMLEVTYQAQIRPWFTVQPDLLYVWMPSGGIANPLVPGVRIGNELVLGVRTTITF